MIAELPPAAILIVGALVVPMLRGPVQKAYLLLLPVLSLVHLLSLAEGTHGLMSVFGYSLTGVHVDRLALVFGYIFHLAAFLMVIYSIHLKDNVQHVAGLIYAGSAIGAAFAGDLFTLFVYWELTAVSSVFLIWTRRTERSYRAGMRYLVIQVGSGVLLLAGIIVHLNQGGTLDFQGRLGFDTDLGTKLILLAFGLKCAFPFLHNWLQDAYPEATVTGTVFLSAFTTKLAVYALARGFPGETMLIYIGVAMTVFPIFYAVIENDLRRVLAYSLNNQLGFMVAGIGVGTAMAINGAVSHAFAHILYKALLFMAMGAVLHRTGTIKASELGGLYKSMPWTASFCLVGAASISAFPLFSGFVTKSLTLTAVADGGYRISWFLLLFASAGVMHHSGIKIPLCGFFGEDRGLRCKEAPLNMLIAMGVSAFLCIFIGVYPQLLYAILPHQGEEAFLRPYTTGHVISQLQLLLFALLAFGVLVRRHLEPKEIAAVNVDFDWTYRRAFPALVRIVAHSVTRVRAAVVGASLTLVARVLSLARYLFQPQGVLARTWSIDVAVLWVVLFLGLYLIAYYLMG